MNVYDKLVYLPVLVPAFMLAAMLHELAHAYVAKLLGDPTAKRAGRLSPNPIVHLDPWGAGLFLFTFLFTSFPFGWARQAPVNRHNLRRPKLDMAMVAFAGPFTNFLLAMGATAVIVHGSLSGTYIDNSLLLFVQLNVVLSVFNLLPIPPLDGARIVGIFLNDRQYETWESLEQYAVLFFVAIYFLLHAQVSIILVSGFDAVYRLLGLLVGA